jgi:hypothetical protein
VLAIVAVLVIGVGVLVAVLVSGGGDDSSSSADGEDEIQLVSVAAPGPNPFTPPVAPAEPPATTIAPPQPPYGGTGDNTLCDREGIIRYLTDPANAAQARAWTNVLSISISDIATYVNDLVPVTLGQDIRITNHTFENGRAVAFQAVLETGTAVLVDVYGTPVVRCRCGNPLLAPRKVADPVYVGTRWPGFSTTNIVTININTTVQVYPPGGTGTIPSSTTAPSSSTTTTRPPPSTSAPAGGADRAVAIMQDKLRECIDALPDSGSGLLTREDLLALLPGLGYSPAPGSAPNVFVVTVTGPEGDVAAWSVNTQTGSAVAADATSAEFDLECPGIFV